MSAEVGTILAEEGAYLWGMDAIVFEYDREATLQHQRNSQLHFVLLLSILGALLAQGLVVLRPALGRIQSSITELVETKQELAAREDALRQEREMLDRVLHISPDHIYFKDRQSRFVRINLAHARWFGLKDPAEAVGKLDSDFFTSEHAEQAFADEQAMMRSGQSMSGIEEKETWPDGRVTWVVTTKTLLFDQLGDVVGIMGVSRDITERKLFEIELARKAEELARSNAELEQFAYVASHDLQEPLRMVASYTQLLERRYKGKLDADADDFIGFAVDGANRMQQLIQDLLSYSRVTTRGKALCLTQTEAACNAAVQNLQQSIKEANASVRVGALPSVQADATQLTQLFQNLIGNAIKYRNERKPEIQVAARLDGSDWIFTVHDNGIGIEPQYFDRIFKMFQRLHTRKEYSGTGIGLAVCRKIVERHGGRIWVESEPGQGSTFHFSLPGSERMQA
jgi:PAS domain S-box-containing protein